MAATLDKDPYTYQKERDAFLKELWQFHQSRGTTYSTIPKIGGKEIDLYLLYCKVNQLGGWDKVSDNEQWEDILEYFKIPRACTNAPSALKSISLRYLYVFQKVQAGDDPDVRQFEVDDESARKRKKTPHLGIAMRYNHRQHIITDSVRQSTGLCTLTGAVHDFVKLERSLVSGLPNEVDFALNACTLLSSEGKRTLQLTTCPHMVGLLLAHVGVFENSKPGTHASSLQVLSEKGWQPYAKRNFLRFWLDSVADKEIHDLILPTSLCVDKRGETVDSSEHVDMEVEPAEDKQGTEEGAQVQESRPDDTPLSEILNLNRELGLNDVEGQRVLQMAMIIRNLSFDEGNADTLASNICVFRFLQLCIHSRYATLRQLALDTLGNLCRKTKLAPIDYRTTQLILRTITRCISSKDKFDVTRGLEMLANLSLVTENMGTLSENLEHWVYEDIVNMLLVHDIQLIVHTLEALYQLSELGQVPATHIADVRAAISILVDLTTVEAQSYGPNSLLGIKVVEHVPPPSPQQLAVAPQHSHQHSHHHHSHHHSHHQHSHSSSHHHHGSPHRTHTPQIARAQAPITVQQLQQQKPQRIQHQGSPQPPVTPRVSLPQPVVQPTPAQPPPPPVPPQQQTGHSTLPETDVESLACNWLQSHIEVSAQGVMTRMELYADYLATCGRQSIRNVINTSSFANCVRVTFPKVDSTRVEKEDGSAEVHYRGLKKKAVPLPFPSLSSRIGLSNQPKPVGQVPQQIPTPVAQLSPTVTKSSVIQQALSSPPQSQRVPPTSLTIAPQPPTSQHGPSYPTLQQALQHKGDGSPMSPPPNQQQFPTTPSSPGVRTSAGPDSNLIKSLLANKVTANMHRTQQQMLVSGQSPCPSQQSMPSQMQSHTTTVTTNPASGHNPSGQHQPKVVPQGLAQTPSSTGASQESANLEKPPSPRSKLKMTLVAKSAAAAGLAQQSGEGNPSSQAHLSKDHLGAESKLEVPKSETDSSKPVQEACIERVQNTYVQKLEQEIVKQNQADLKDSSNPQGVASTPAPKAHGLVLEEGAVKPELVSQDKRNGVGAANGSHDPQNESQSVKSNNQVSPQLLNGNTEKQIDQLQLDTKDSRKSILVDSDKLLTPEEIEKRKQEEVAQLLERNKDQVLGMNGIINHVGNGECALPAGLQKGPLSKDVFNPDKTSGLSLSNQQFKLQLQQQLIHQQHAEQKGTTIIENGYSSPKEDNHRGEDDSKVNIPSDLGRPAPGLGSTRNNAVINNPEQTVKVEDQNQAISNQASSNKPDFVNNPKDINVGAGAPNNKTETPMEVETADTTVGNNGPGLKSGGTSQSEVDNYSNKFVGNLTIAEMLKQRETVASDSQSTQTRSSVPQQVVLPAVSVSQSTGLPAALPAVGLMSQLSSVQTIISNTTNTSVSGATSRPTVLPSSVHTNPQLAKLSTEAGSVRSPTLANLPTPGDLASQVKTAMQSPPMVSIQSQQTGQASAIMHQLHQPMQQQQQQQQQVVLQQQQSQQQQNFAAHMQQLQQRLQLPPQVSLPAMTQQQAHQPIVTVAQQQPQPQAASASAPQAPQQQSQPQKALQPIQPQPIQPSIKSQLMQRLQQPLAPARPVLQPQIPAQPTTGQQAAPILIQSHSQAGQQQQQPLLLPQTGVNGQVHQVVLSSQQATTTQPIVQQSLGQTVTLVQSQGQPIQVMSNQGQQVQVVSNTTGPQALQVVNSQGAAQIQVIQGQGQQIQVVAGQGQQLLQGQAVVQGQVVPGGLQVRGQQVQVMPGQCVQMVHGQPQVMQLQMPPGQQIVFQTQSGTGQRLIQPTVSQQQQQQQQHHQQQQQAGQVKQGQILLPRPAQTTTQTQQVLIVSQPTSGVTVTQPKQVQAAHPQLVQSHSQQHPATVVSQQQQTHLTAQQKPLNIQTQQQLTAKEPLVSPSVGMNSQKRPSTILKSEPVKKGRTCITDSVVSSTGLQIQGSQTQASQTTVPPRSTTGDYRCDWAGCKSCFETQKACSSHVVKYHFGVALDSGFCRWEGCDKLKRQRWSLITHIRDRHLTEHALRAAHVKRQQAAAAASAGASAGTAADPPPVYPADAALQAIRRFAPRQPYPEFTEPKEGPVTKHIRLTSGLILRNIAKFSEKGRTALLKHEKHLSSIALSSVEASTAIAHCLWELQRNSSPEEVSTKSKKH